MPSGCCRPRCEQALLRQRVEPLAPASYAKPKKRTRSIGQHGALLRTADMLSSSTLTLRPLPRAGVHCCRRLSTAAGIRCSRLSTAASASASAPASAATAAAAAAPRSARVQALDRLAEGMARPMSEMEIASGSGSYLASATGERYLDFTSGIGVTNTGHCHPKVGHLRVHHLLSRTVLLTYALSLCAACSSSYSCLLTYVPRWSPRRSTRWACSSTASSRSASPRPNPNPDP